MGSIFHLLQLRCCRLEGDNFCGWSRIFCCYDCYQKVIISVDGVELSAVTRLLLVGDNFCGWSGIVCCYASTLFVTKAKLVQPQTIERHSLPHKQWRGIPCFSHKQWRGIPCLTNKIEAYHALVTNVALCLFTITTFRQVMLHLSFTLLQKAF